MREILFRGKRIDNGEWIEGYLCKCEFLQNRVYILPIAYVAQVCHDERHELMIGGFAEVDPVTVGEYTGLADCRRMRIYEGDIIRTKKYGKVVGHTNVNDYDTFYVTYRLCVFRLERDKPDRGFHLVDNGFDKMEIIGNIHDNPELLEVTK